VFLNIFKMVFHIIAMDHSTLTSGSDELLFCAHPLGNDSQVQAENPNRAAEKGIVLFPDNFEELWEGLKDPTRSVQVSVVQLA